MSSSPFAHLQYLTQELDRYQSNLRSRDCRLILRLLASEVQGLQLLASAKPPKPASKLEQAMTWLADLLGTVSRPTELVFREGSRAGHTRITLRRALKLMGAVYIHSGCRREKKVAVGLPKKIAEILSTNEMVSTNEPTRKGRKTTAKPGTEARLLIMERRAERQEPVTRSDDATMTDRDVLQLERYEGNFKERGLRLRPE